MENITLGQISGVLSFIILFCGSIFTIHKTIKSSINNALKPTNDKIDQLDSSLKKLINKVDMNSTKNFLVARITDIKNEVEINDVMKERFWEQYQHYKELNGNSYITNEVEHLKRVGKI